LDYIIEKK